VQLPAQEDMWHGSWCVIAATTAGVDMRGDLLDGDVDQLPQSAALSSTFWLPPVIISQV
jgi:hypothetical protein